MNDRQLTISAANSRYAAKWARQTLWWSDLVKRLQDPVRSTETLQDFLRMPKSEQDNLKDVGGYVGGALKDGRRSGKNVLGRDVITLDLDNIPGGGTAEALRRLSALGCAYAVHSTRKHEESRPRLRVLLPANRTVEAEEYEPIARKMAELITMEWADPSTFEASRLMYYPSCSKDSQYVMEWGDRPFFDADGVLAMYQDWHDHSEWPRRAYESEAVHKQVLKQQNPEEKAGVVGAFCKLYGIRRAMDELLPGTYLPTDKEDRFTFAGGTTFGGAILYEDTFLFSHHAHDPAGGKLCNAWDLVRLHRFSDLDYEADPKTPGHKLPSFLALSEMALKDEAVSAQLNKERYEKANKDFAEAAI